MATVEGIWYPLSAEVLIWNVDGERGFSGLTL